MENKQQEKQSSIDTVIKYTKLQKHILLQKSEPITEFGNELTELIERMVSTLYFYGAMGISAIQIGIPKQVFLIKTSADSYAVFINPETIETSPETDIQLEGCLSFPEVFVPVQRSVRVTTKFFDATGEEHTVALEGLHARCYQHEYDHLQGITFLSHLSKLKQELIFTKMRKLEKTGKINKDEMAVKYIEAMASANQEKNEQGG